MLMQWLKKTRSKRILQNKSAAKAKRPPCPEYLEERTLLSAATPWPNPTHLTLSFAPDGTQVAGQPSALFGTLSAQMPEAEWQLEILRAFQAWTEVANVNVSVVNDNGAPLGTRGQMQGDPRFGDIRIATRAMPREAISLSVRPDAVLSETWSGDILVNSAYTFDGIDANLNAVMLHEAGHALGVGHSSDPDSVMYSHSNSTTALSADDIASIQSLYGTRSPDRFDAAAGNSTFATATKLDFRDKGFTPLALFGDITTTSDTDVYSMRVPETYRGSATIRLRADGVSLLAPRLTIYDASGRVLNQVQSQVSSGGVLVIRIPQVLPKGLYYLRVEAVAGSAFAVGTYGVAISLDNSSTVSPELIDAVLQGPYQKLEPDAIGKLLRDPSSIPSGVSIETNDWNDGSECDAVSDDEPVDRIGEVQATDGVLVNGVVVQGGPESVHSLFIAQPQLFRLDLSLGSVDATQDVAIQGTVLDEQGNIVASLTAKAGATPASSTIFLAPGLYSVVLISVPSSATTVSSVTYTLHGGNISEPIGPVVVDPTPRPVYACPGTPGSFCYPGIRPTPRSFFLSPSPR